MCSRLENTRSPHRGPSCCQFCLETEPSQQPRTGLHSGTGAGDDDDDDDDEHLHGLMICLVVGTKVSYANPKVLIVNINSANTKVLHQHNI